VCVREGVEVRECLSICQKARESERESVCVCVRVCVCVCLSVYTHVIVHNERTSYTCNDEYVIWGGYD